ncbi:MAG: FecR family protein [Mangrovibacterium sp.]
MNEKLHTGEEQIVSHFHAKDDTPIPQHLKGTRDYKETEKIFRLRDHVAFLSSLSTEDQLWKGIEARIEPRPAFQRLARYAAIIVLSITFGAGLVYFSGIRSHEPAMASVTSPRGQITSLKLFDGSTVWLNSESTLTYSSDFNSAGREVYVEGEAYFEVVPDRERPFVVHLENSAISVLGTHFNVKSYPGSERVEAVLVEGTIEFTCRNGSVLLKPQERVVLSAREGTIIKDRANIESVLAWKKGKYYYSNEGLPAIIEQLQRWYDIEFVFNKDELSSYTFTGVINHEKSIEYNLQLIELTNRIDARFKNGKIIITGK